MKFFKKITTQPYDKNNSFMCQKDRVYQGRMNIQSKSGRDVRL
jgi:hypothetical protein